MFRDDGYGIFADNDRAVPQPAAELRSLGVGRELQLAHVEDHHEVRLAVAIRVTGAHPQRRRTRKRFELLLHLFQNVVVVFVRANPEP